MQAQSKRYHMARCSDWALKSVCTAGKTPYIYDIHCSLIALLRARQPHAGGHHQIQCHVDGACLARLVVLAVSTLASTSAAITVGDVLDLTGDVSMTRHCASHHAVCRNNGLSGRCEHYCCLRT